MTRLSTIIIAAGDSSRLGQPKQLVRKQGQTLLRCITTLALSVCEDVQVIIGYRAEKISNEIDDLRVNHITNVNWHQGMGSSIACGVSHLNKSTDGVLILLCDQWAITRHDLEKLIVLWQKMPDKIIASRYFEKKQDKEVIGAPAIFPRSYFLRLGQLRETGARKLLMEHQNDVIALNMIDAAFDLDTPEDLRQFEHTCTESFIRR